MCAFPFVYAHPRLPELHISRHAGNVCVYLLCSSAPLQTHISRHAGNVSLHLCTLTRSAIPAHFQHLWKCVAYMVHFTCTFPEMLEMCGLQCPSHPHISRDAGNVRLTWSVSPTHFQHLWKCAVYMVHLTRTFLEMLEMCGLHGPPHLHISGISGNVWFTWSTSPAHFRHLRKCVIYMVRLTCTFPVPLQMCPPHTSIISCSNALCILNTSNYTVSLYICFVTHSLLYPQHSSSHHSPSQLAL